MPKRDDISSILIIGAGPIIIGQACEFDYSGTQACKALKEEGFRVILINSNPATIMTDPDMADATYIEPLHSQTVLEVIKAEKPDAILPTMGGQTALNLAMELDQNGTLAEYGVKLIGASREAINKAEDRFLFREAMNRIGLESPNSAVANSLDEAKEALNLVGLPSIIRPAFTLGGTGGGIAYNKSDFEALCLAGLAASPVHQILIDESLLGWKEYEMEVVRDTKDNVIIVCSIENIDPMGVHTGDSVTVAPALTLTDKEYQRMRNGSIKVLREIGVETGGSNVQWAVNPQDGRMVIIEMNPRVSRSSALASKATGFPIAKVAAKLAIGYTLDELANDITQITPASFEPTIDYIVTKIPRFAFEKFPDADDELNTAMKSVGEAMAIGRSFHESLQKALASLETGLDGLDEIDIPDAPEKGAIYRALSKRSPDRIRLIAQAMRFGLTNEEINRITAFDHWFLDRIREIVIAENWLKSEGLPQNPKQFRALKMMGFTDTRLARLCSLKETEVRQARHQLKITPVFKRIDTCAAEFDALTPYMYSSYEEDNLKGRQCESWPTDKKKIVVLGGGPNRIGQGIEFDYCCCHACLALAKAGYETIMINCNPETVSTDYDTSDRLYFEPLRLENVIEILNTEAANGTLVGIIVQFGGQTPLKLANDLEQEGFRILGTSPQSIDLAEDRDRFKKLLENLNLRQPENDTAWGVKEAEQIANRIGYPVVIRPSYVLGGRAMEIVHDSQQLHRYMNQAVIASGTNPVLIDKFLPDATEVDVDAVANQSGAYIAGIMEHIELAGIHSGDSACVIPPHTLHSGIISQLKEQTRKMAKALHVTGLMNVQFAVQGEDIFVLEVNPRASRTVPFVAKVIGTPIASIASRVMVGEELESFQLNLTSNSYFGVKEAVFPFKRFSGVDCLLGPEMRSTGEVMGLDTSFEAAFFKAQQGAGINIPLQGNTFISIKDADKTPRFIQVAQTLLQLGYDIVATKGTQFFLSRHGVACTLVNKVHETRPNIIDLILNGEVAMIMNTTDGVETIKDSREMRALAVAQNIPYFTTTAAAYTLTQALQCNQGKKPTVRSLQSLDYLANPKPFVN